MIFDDIIENGELFKGVWDTQRFTLTLEDSISAATQKKTERLLTEQALMFADASIDNVTDEHERRAKHSVTTTILQRAKTKRQRVLFLAAHETGGLHYLALNDGRAVRQWIFSKEPWNQDTLESALETLIASEERDLLLIPTGSIVFTCRLLTRAWRSNETKLSGHKVRLCLEVYSHGRAEIALTANREHKVPRGENLTHLDRLEAESMHIIREVMAESENPVMLYSVGKDSSVRY